MPAYVLSPREGELRQSEIITGLVQYIYDPVAEEATSIRHDFALVAHQDCDLLRDWEYRNNDEIRNILNGVLLFELTPFEIAKSNLPGGDIRRRIQRHGEERYYLLMQVPPELDALGEGLPELVIDFRRYFTISVEEIYRQCMIDGEDGAKRRCRLETPYKEHLQNRAAAYFQRVALPE